MDRRLIRTPRYNVAAPIILDFQCFKDNNNSYILKEVCVLEADSGTLMLHHIARPPYDREFLSEEKLRESYWLTKHCHGLKWDHGDISYYALIEKLKVCVAKRPTIYVKGSEKKDYVRQNLISDPCTTNVIDLNDLGCGSLASTSNLLSTNALRCRHHKSVHNRCALSNCVVLRGWLFLSANIDEANEDINSYLCSCFHTTSSTTCATVGIDTVV